MKEGFIVVRVEAHIDDAFWVCETREDALKIAADVTAYWKNERGIPDDYDPDGDDAEDDDGFVEFDIDTNLHGDLIFHYSVDDGFRVYAQPQLIRSAGETEQVGE